MSATKEQIHAAAMASHRTVEVEIGSVKATLRELSVAERKQLDESNYQKNGDDFATRVDPKDGETYLVPIEEKVSMHNERWIAATMQPAVPIEQIAQWPVSLKRRLAEEAKKVNNVDVAAVTAKNS